MSVGKSRRFSDFYPSSRFETIPNRENLMIGNRFSPKAAFFAVSTLSIGLSAPAALALSFNLQEATISSINRAFDEGLTSERLVELYLNRIATYDDAGPRINSVLTINPNVLNTARQLDLERKNGTIRGPLHGIPILLKDNIDTSDMPTTGGSAALRGSQPTDDAFAVQLLRDAGAIILGKAEMDEFAISGGGYSSIGGATINPYRLNRTSAGSSSGSGAAIASNFAVFAMGSDTGGSIRTPCSFQGLVCIRPTRGLVSLDSVIPFVLSRDAIGPMARTVEDAAIALGVLAEFDPTNPTLFTPIAPPPVDQSKFFSDYTQFLNPNALNGARIGIVRNYVGNATTTNGVDPTITALVENALTTMRGLGATIVDVTFTNAFLTTMARTYGASATPFEQKLYLEQYLAGLAPQYPKTLSQLISVLESPPISTSSTPSTILGTLRSSNRSTGFPIPPDTIGDTIYQNYVTGAVNATPIVRNTLLDTLDSLDLDTFLFPTVNTFARPLAGVTDPTFVSPSGSAPVRQVEFASSSGLPDITVPAGFNSQGLPFTLSFTGRPYDESRLLGLAYSFEQATRFRRSSPLLPALAGETIPEPSVVIGLGTAAIASLSLRKRAKR